MIERIREWLESDKSVIRVAKDLQLTSELILLVRMIFADGQLKPEELSKFKKMCRVAFDIPEEDVADVLKYLQEFGYETTVDDAVAMFENLDPERKQRLLLNMLEIAKSDNELHKDEAELIRRTASILGIGPADLEALRSR